MGNLKAAQPNRKQRVIHLGTALGLATLFLIAWLAGLHGASLCQVQAAPELWVEETATHPATPGKIGHASTITGWDGMRVADPVVITDSGLYQMWYTGWGQDGKSRIGFATSPDGVNWAKYAGNPVLDVGPVGAWDSDVARVSAVIKEGATYHMWYLGNGHNRVGYATSSDGITWSKYGGNPVLDLGPASSWEDELVSFAGVISDSGIYKMWYAGGDSPGFGGIVQTGYATSTDGINWTKYAGNPVLGLGPSAWDSTWAFDTHVISGGGPYQMWYSGSEGTMCSGSEILRIGYATSTDGITWTKSLSNPVLDVDPTGWDSRSATAPWVIFDGSTYHMWYHGGVPCSSKPEMIGYATSPDGVTWTKHPDNPVLKVTPNDCVVTSLADSGPGTLRDCMSQLTYSSTITFDTSVFPPSNPATIAPTSGLPGIGVGNVMIDASDAGVILDGSSIGTMPETLLLDDLSLTLGDGPNLLSNGDFSAGLGHWRPQDDGPGAIRSLVSDAYQWSVVAHTGQSRIVYDTTDTSDPISRNPYHDANSTVWISATGGSTASVSFRYRGDGPASGVLTALLSDGTHVTVVEWWFDPVADWAEAIVPPQLLPTDTVAVAVQLYHPHSQAWTDGLWINSDSNAIQGLQILNFPDNGIEVGGDARYNLIGGDHGVGAGPMGQGNLISGNGSDGIAIYGTSAMSNTISGNYIGTDLSGQTVIGNGGAGVFMGGGTRYNLVGGSNASPAGDCSGKCNLISGNEWDGVAILDSGTVSNTVSGNYIGIDVSGTVGLGNGESDDGVGMRYGPSYNIIGGTTPGERNVISGHGDNGVKMDGSDTRYNVVIGNFIGTNASGTAAIGNSEDGVAFQDGANHNRVGGSADNERNLISGNGEAGVNIRGGSIYNIVSGNYIGTNISGTAVISNATDGVLINGVSQSNLIGGNTPGERNLISGNGGNGVSIENSGTMSNTVSGNYIGTDVSGIAAISNGVKGIFIRDGAQYNLIGGDTADERNLISGNAEDGVVIWGLGTISNTVSGNYIGTDISGTAALGNGLGNGNCGTSVVGYAELNRVGGSTPGERNLISGNGCGVALAYASRNMIQGNHIGTAADGTADLGNRGYGIMFRLQSNDNLVENNLIAYTTYNDPMRTGPGILVLEDSIRNTLRQNHIHSNVDEGISLRDGGNLELFPPMLTDVSTNTVAGLAPPNSTVEIFSDAEDEGRYYHGSAAADASGHFTFTQASVFTGTNVTATATDSDGNTSEFSAAYEPRVDVQVVAILQPKSSGKTNQTVTPTVKIGNAGTTQETGISISVAGTGSALSSDYADSQTGLSLPPLGYATLTFAPLTPSIVGTYDFTATVSLAGDQDSSNDGQAQTVAVGSDVIDLWTRDHPSDVGDVPAYPFWQSPDMWVRNVDDGGSQHQEPIANQENWVYLVIRNRGDAASEGVSDKAKVYWHEPSLGIKCGSWAPIASQTITNVAAQTGTQLLKFSWTPTRTGHTCLLSEINSVADPVVNPCDIPWDNNLSQRNVEILAGGAGMGAQAAGGMVIEVTNVREAPKPVTIMLDVSEVPDPDAVRLDLGADLAARWAKVEGIKGSSGITWSGGSLITVTDSSLGAVAGIPFAGGETHTVTLLVDAPSVETTTVSVYAAIDAGPGIPLADAVVGGNTYIFSTEVEEIYLPIILKNH